MVNESMPKYVQRGIAALVVVVLGILMLRLATQVRQLQERIDALEAAASATAETGGQSAAEPATVRPQGRKEQPPQRQSAAGTPRQPKTAAAQGNHASLAAPPADADQPTREPETGKFRTPTLVELNTADSATLVRIPGIAARTAQAILAYRDQLGGYVSPRQLEERLTWDAAREHMDEWCSDWLTADTTLVRRLAVGEASFRALLRHPYLNYEQVQQLVRYRDRQRHIPGLDALRQLDAFSEADIERLRPYLDFGPDSASVSRQRTSQRKRENKPKE